MCPRRHGHCRLLPLLVNLLEDPRALPRRLLLQMEARETGGYWQRRQRLQPPLEELSRAVWVVPGLEWEQAASVLPMSFSQRDDPGGSAGSVLSAYTMRTYNRGCHVPSSGLALPVRGFTVESILVCAASSNRHE